MLKSTYVLLMVHALAACAHVEQDTPRDDVLDVISYRSVPDGTEALKDECACLNTDIRRINGFTENMKRSKYSMFYLAMGREKVTALRSRADDIGCTIVPE